jgi:hypothetical protein
MEYDLSIIILSYNTKGLLKDLLQSVINSKHNGYQVETIVVDNASYDGSPEMVKKQFPKIKLLINKENLGFSKGNNGGIKIAQGRYLLFLNSDTLLEKDTLFKMIEFMDSHSQYAAATCRVELPSGDLDPACHRGFPTPWAAFTYFSGLEKIFPKSRIFARYHQGWKNLNIVHEIEAISGAFFMIRKKTLDRVGYFDERFFMYGEDIDLCFRISQSGQQTCFYPDTKIIHHKKQSGRQRNLNNKVAQKDLEIRLKSRNDFYHTMKIFYDKHYKHKYPSYLKHLILLGIWLVSKFRD